MNEDEIKVGEYIRSKDGYIGRVELIIEDEQEKQNYYICGKDEVMASNYRDNILKHSKNIMKLIEKGDYYNRIPIVHKLKDGRIQLLTGYVFSNEDIKEGDNIVTKEQFENVKYKI